MINQTKGLQRFLSWKDLSVEEQTAIVNDWQNNAGIRKVSAAKAQQMIQGALWNNQQQKLPLPASFCLRDIFSGKDLTPQKFVSNLEAKEENGYRLVQNSNYLVKEFPFNQWWLNFDNCREYVVNNIAERKNVDYAALKGFISEFWEHRREEIAQKLILTADLMHAIASEDYQKQIQTCLALHTCLLNNNKPLWDIPFIRQLALINIRQIQKLQ